MSRNRSPTAVEIANCSRKVRYRDENEAVLAGAKYQQRPYRCDVCGGWHTTSGIAGRIAKAKTIPGGFEHLARVMRSGGRKVPGKKQVPRKRKDD